MPRRRQFRKNYVDLADLVSRNCNQYRHHPYSLRPSTLRRQPGSMNERVLWQNQINPPPPDFDENHIINRLSLSSRSRLLMAPVNIITPGSTSPEMQALAAQTAQRLNRMATAVIMARPVDSKKTNSQNQFTVDETQSTVVLHQNPLFHSEGDKTSGMLSKKAQSKETQNKLNAKKKRALAKGSSGSKPYSLLTGSAAQKNKCDKAKRELDTSSSNDGDITRVESKKRSRARIKSEVDIEVAGSGESKDQELAPPPPSPVLPNVQNAHCPTLTAILESVDNFLRNVKKS